jgi:hypothetical protein
VTDGENVPKALERVGTVRDRTAGKLRATSRFETEVRDVSSISASTETSPAAVDAGVGPIRAVASQAQTQPDCCARIRNLFDETIHPYRSSVTGDAGQGSTTEAIRREFVAELAQVLSPETDNHVTVPVRRALLSKTADRREELEATVRALGVELASLKSAAAELEEIKARVDDAPPLLELGFEALATRHETLRCQRVRCDELARKRQRTLRSTTNRGVVGVDHRPLVERLYRKHPTTYPVLAAVAILSDRCERRERAVRDQLVRRV